jgi:hypothetical protein
LIEEAARHPAADRIPVYRERVAAHREAAIRPLEVLYHDNPALRDEGILSRVYVVLT